MSSELQVLGIIPARGGSKGIPRKNIALLGGKPLIAWTIQPARSSLQLNRLVVSTNDEEIAEISRQWGAEVPFIRPNELAQDETPGIAPILHAVTWLETNEAYMPDLIMCLQATSPFRSPEDIDAAIALIKDKKADSVVSVMPLDHPPAWNCGVDTDGRLRPVATSDNPVARRQDQSPVYALNGAIYLVRRDVLLEQKDWYTDATYAYIMPAERSMDIDTPWHLQLAELIVSDHEH